MLGLGRGTWAVYQKQSREHEDLFRKRYPYPIPKILDNDINNFDKFTFLYTHYSAFSLFFNSYVATGCVLSCFPAIICIVGIFYKKKKRKKRASFQITPIIILSCGSELCLSMAPSTSTLFSVPSNPLARTYFSLFQFWTWRLKQFPKWKLKYS